VLGGGESRRRLDLGSHILFESNGNLFLLGVGKLRFFRVAGEDHASIGVAFIAELPVGIERIDIVPILVQQFLVTHFGRVVADAHHLLVAFVIAVIGIGLGTASIA